MGMGLAPGHGHPVLAAKPVSGSAKDSDGMTTESRLFLACASG
jgi:hypothetical protein